MNSHVPIITIDGASGVGKGTLAFSLAAKLGYKLLDSGAIYRALALYAIDLNIDLEDSAKLAKIAHNIPLRFEKNSKGLDIFLGEKNITANLRLEQTGTFASILAKHNDVRQALIAFQKNFANEPGLIADGRDMGTCIFPDAKIKLFLHASAQIRAQRRFEQLLKQGFSATMPNLIDDINARDHRDRTRAVSPLIAAEDALIIDTSSLDGDQVFKLAWNYIESKI